MYRYIFYVLPVLLDVYWYVDLNSQTLLDLTFVFAGLQHCSSILA